jgi:hypothetical protein
LRSADGGASFSSPVTVAATAFKPTPGLRAPPLPSAEVDAAGTIYVAWPDCGPGCEQDRIVLSSSTDGITWSQPRRIPLARGFDYVLPGLGVDPLHRGRLALAYYVWKAGDAVDVGFATSSDGARRWNTPGRLSVQTMRLSWPAQAGGAMLGDYISTSFSGGRAVAVFVLASPPVRGRRDQPLFVASIR